MPVIRRHPTIQRGKYMIKVISVILLLAGILGLILGVLGIFGRDLVTINPWGLAILGVIFFTAGIGLMKRQV
jgi:hypothetical protein